MGPAICKECELREDHGLGMVTASPMVSLLTGQKVWKVPSK